MLRKLPLLAAILSTLLTCTLAALPARAQALAERVPADALVYAGWQGTDKLQPQYNPSHLKAVIDASSFPAFLSKNLPAIIDKLGANANADADKAELAQQILRVATVMAKYPTALYVGPVELDGMPNPRVAVFCVAGDQAAAVEKDAKALVERAGDSMPIKIASKRIDNTVIVTLGNLPPETINLIAGKPGPAALNTNKQFTTTMAQVGKDPALAVYVNTPGLVAMGDQVTAKFAPNDPHWTRLKTALNLPGLGEIACSSGFDGKDWSTQAYVALNGPRTGIPMLLDMPALSDDTLKLAPQSTTFAVAGRLDTVKIFDEVISVITKINPDAKSNIDETLAEFTHTTDLNLRKDLLAPLGDQWLLYAAPTVGGNSWSSLVLVTPLKDPPAAVKSTATLEKKAAEAAGEGPQYPMQPDFRPKKTTMDGLEVHHFNLFIVSPSWAIKDGRLYISLLPQAIPSAVDAAAGGKSLLDNEAYIAVRNRLGVKQPNAVQFIDLPRTAPDAYATLSQMLTLIGMFAGEDAPPSLLPPLHKVLPHLTPAGSAAWSDQTGWHYKEIAPFPGAVLFGGQQSGGGLIGMSASPYMMMYAMYGLFSGGRSGQSRPSLDAANQTAIAQAAIIWANEHTDKMPEHLAQLIANGSISPKSLLIPGSGTTPLELTDAQKKAIAEDPEKAWKDLVKDVDAHCDYVYLGKDTKNTADATQILLYGKPGLGRQKGGMNVVFYDGHTEWVRAANLKETFKATNEMRKELKLPEIDTKDIVFPAETAPAAETLPAAGTGVAPK